MSRERGYRVVPFTLNRRMVAASAAVSRERSPVHGLCWVDITEPRRLIGAQRGPAGDELSFTAYVVACVARAVAETPQLNAFRRGRKLVLLEDVTVGTLLEREVGGETVPELVPIHGAQDKSCRRIHEEIRARQHRRDGRLAGPSGVGETARFLPDWALRWAVRRATRRVSRVRRSGVVVVTSVGLFGRNPGWGIPVSVWTVMVTVGGMGRGPAPGARFPLPGPGDGEREHVCLTFSFDHEIVDGGPGTRFMSRVAELIRSGDLLRETDPAGDEA